MKYSHAFPPSLSEFGNLRLPSMKSDLLKCTAQSQHPELPILFDCRICDGAVIVHCLPVTRAVTFDDYAENVFIPYIRSQGSRRVDVGWDTYLPDSLKESTQEKRGKGVRRKVSAGTKLPPNWMQFLGDSVNKEELFAFLTSKAAAYNWPDWKTVYVTSGFYYDNILIMSFIHRKDIRFTILSIVLTIMFTAIQKKKQSNPIWTCGWRSEWDATSHSSVSTTSVLV